MRNAMYGYLQNTNKENGRRRMSTMTFKNMAKDLKPASFFNMTKFSTISGDASASILLSLPSPSPNSLEVEDLSTTSLPWIMFSSGSNDTVTVFSNTVVLQFI